MDFDANTNSAVFTEVMSDPLKLADALAGGLKEVETGTSHLAQDNDRTPTATQPASAASPAGAGCDNSSGYDSAPEQAKLPEDWNLMSGAIKGSPQGHHRTPSKVKFSAHLAAQAVRSATSPDPPSVQTMPTLSESGIGNFSIVSAPPAQQATVTDTSSNASVTLHDVNAAIATLANQVATLGDRLMRHEKECAGELETLSRKIGGSWSESGKDVQRILPLKEPKSGVTSTSAQALGPRPTPKTVPAGITVESTLRRSLRACAPLTGPALRAKLMVMVNELQLADDSEKYTRLPSTTEEAEKLAKYATFRDALANLK